MEERINKLQSGMEISYFNPISDLPPLIFIHGLRSNKKAFNRNWYNLRKQFKIFVIDFTNKGNSSKSEFPPII